MEVLGKFLKKKRKKIKKKIKKKQICFLLSQITLNAILYNLFLFF